MMFLFLCPLSKVMHQGFHYINYLFYDKMKGTNEEIYWGDNLSEDKIAFSSWIRLVIGMSLYGFVSINFFWYGMILFPVWFMLDAIKEGIVHSNTAMMSTSIVLMIFVSLEIGLIVLLLSLPLVTIFHYLILSNKTYRYTMVTMTLIFIISLLTLVVPRVDEATLVEIRSGAVDRVDEIYSSDDYGSYEIERLKDEINNAYNNVYRLMPALIMLGSISIVYINYTMTGRMLIADGVLIQQPPYFYMFRLPPNIIIGAIVSSLTVYFLKVLGLESWELIFLNLVLLFGFSFLVQGFACINYLLLRLNVNRLLRVGIYIVLIVISSSLPIIVGVGLVESIFNFRKAS